MCLTEGQACFFFILEWNNLSFYIELRKWKGISLSKNVQECLLCWNVTRVSFSMASTVTGVSTTATSAKANVTPVLNKKLGVLNSCDFNQLENTQWKSHMHMMSMILLIEVQCSETADDVFKWSSRVMLISRHVFCDKRDEEITFKRHTKITQRQPKSWKIIKSSQSQVKTASSQKSP